VNFVCGCCLMLVERKRVVGEELVACRTTLLTAVGVTKSNPIFTCSATFPRILDH
jgi:hypothetical protein